MMETVTYTERKLQGETGKLLHNIIDRWLIGIRETNPAILTMFRDRDVKPYRGLMPWSGEFAGKYLTAAALTYQLDADPALLEYIERFIEEFLSYQDANGYLGCFSRECQLTGAFSQTPETVGATWDSWAHYHAIIGLLLWYDITGNEAYRRAVERIADLYERTFYNGKRRVLDMGQTEMNTAIYHAFAMLYRRTGEPRYLRLAECVEKDIESEGAGRYLHYALSGFEFYQCPKPRWESLHAIMGYAEMYRATGNERYREALSKLVYSILRTDIHNTGAFSTDEQAIGNPYENRNIETCCVIAYNALVIELFKINDDLKLVDFLERSHYNAVLGYYSPSGRWSTYNTPMDGVKCANYHIINFQSAAASPDLNCCSVNAPRGVANVESWMLTKKQDIVYLNFYEDMRVETEDGLSLIVTGGYPAKNTVHLHIESGKVEREIGLRVPGWSTNTVVTCNGAPLKATAGEYLMVKVFGTAEVMMQFDFTPYLEKGDGDYAGKCSVFVGPVLYGADTCDNITPDIEHLPPLPWNEVAGAQPVLCKNGVVQLPLPCGVTLRDFYHLGEDGGAYKTWLVIGD